MKERTGNRFRDGFCSVLCFLATLAVVLPAHAFTLGETYDKSNWEEIKDFGPPSLIRYVKKGDFVLKTVELDFEWKVTEPRFVEEARDECGARLVHAKNDVDHAPPPCGAVSVSSGGQQAAAGNFTIF